MRLALSHRLSRSMVHPDVVLRSPIGIVESLWNAGRELYLCPPKKNATKAKKQGANKEDRLGS